MAEQPYLAQINIIVSDVKASVRFYRLLGLEIDDSRPFSEHHVAVRMPNGFLLEIDSLAFAPKWNAGSPGTIQQNCNVIGFNLPSREAVDATFSRITEAGYKAQQPPMDAFWGARYAIVEDPDRNAIGLMSPIDPNRTGTPPSL